MHRLAHHFFIWFILFVSVSPLIFCSPEFFAFMLFPQGPLCEEFPRSLGKLLGDACQYAQEAANCTSSLKVCITSNVNLEPGILLKFTFFVMEQPPFFSDNFSLESRSHCKFNMIKLNCILVLMYILSQIIFSLSNAADRMYKGKTEFRGLPVKVLSERRMGAYSGPAMQSDRESDLRSRMYFLRRKYIDGRTSFWGTSKVWTCHGCILSKGGMLTKLLGVAAFMHLAHMEILQGLSPANGFVPKTFYFVFLTKF